jgi:hypothetical protein
MGFNSIIISDFTFLKIDEFICFNQLQIQNLNLSTLKLRIKMLTKKIMLESVMILNN